MKSAMFISLVALVTAASIAVSRTSEASPARHSKNETAKIAVGPDAPDDSSLESVDPTDAVDKPITKPVVVTTDAPSSEPNASLVTTAPSANEEKAPTTEALEQRVMQGLKEPASVHSADPVADEPVKKEHAGKAAPLDTDAVIEKFERENGDEAAAVKPEIKAPVEGVTAEQALKWLENGNTRYVTKKFRADGRTESDRAKKSHAACDRPEL